MLMDIIIFTSLIIIVFIVAFRANRKQEIYDAIAMKEVENDFKEEFEQKNSNELSVKRNE